MLPEGTAELFQDGFLYLITGQNPSKKEHYEKKHFNYLFDPWEISQTDLSLLPVLLA